MELWPKMPNAANADLTKWFTRKVVLPVSPAVHRNAVEIAAINQNKKSGNFLVPDFFRNVHINVTMRFFDKYLMLQAFSGNLQPKEVLPFLIHR